MDAERLDREWSAWLEGRKRPAPPDPEFTHRVMEAVREEARLARNGSPGSTRAGRMIPFAGSRPGGPPWKEWLRRALSPRPALAFATLVFAAVLAVRNYSPGTGSDGEGVRIKGGAYRVGYLLKRGARIAPAVSGKGFRPGDRLQAVYSADGAGYIRFYSIDASGRIECLSCAGPDSLLPAGQDKTFPFALELDADPADEALVGIWTAAPSRPADLEPWLRDAWVRSQGDVSGVERALSRGGPSGSRVSVFLLRKEPGR